MESVNYTRTELYELVWSESLLSISKRYNISDVGLRKICIKMNIPLPGQGHWQKVRSGQRIYAKKLPKNFTGEDHITLKLRTEDEEQGLTLHALEKEIKARLDTHDAAIVEILSRFMDIIDPPELTEPPRKRIGFGVKEKRAKYRARRKEQRKADGKGRNQ